MRKDCALAKLTEEQQADLFDWLTTESYEVVLKRISQRPPRGFGIRTHVNTLFRFYEQRQAKIRAHDLANLQASPPLVGSPLPRGEESEVRGSSTRSTQDSELRTQDLFLAAASTAFAHSTYLLAHSPMTPATYRAVSRGLYQQQDARIKREFLEIAREQVALGRERLELERAQFEYNAARAALSLLPELIAIDQLTNIDDEAKIWRVRDRLFGASPLPTMPKEKRPAIDAERHSLSPAPHPALSPEERVLVESASCANSGLPIAQLSDRKSSVSDPERNPTAPAPHPSLSPGERVSGGVRFAEERVFSPARPGEVRAFNPAPRAEDGVSGRAPRPEESACRGVPAPSSVHSTHQTNSK